PKVAGGGDQYIVRRIVPADVADQTLAVETTHAAARAQNRTPQGLPAPIGLGEDLVHQVVRGVLHHFDLFLDDAAFIGDMRGFEERIFHQVGKDAEGPAQVLV